MSHVANAETRCEATSNKSVLDAQKSESSLDSHPRICLLGADYENSNLGIRALATGALMAIYSQYPNASVEMLEYGVNPKEYNFDLPIKTTRVRMRNIRFSKKLWQPNHIVRLLVAALAIRLTGSQSLRDKLCAQNAWLRSVVQADQVLSLSYGDSFSDIYGYQRFFYVSLPQILALLLKKNLVQLPQTIGPFKSGLCRAVAKWILSRSAAIWSRDEKAVAGVRTLLPSDCSRRVQFCHDLAFVVPPKVPANISPPLDRVFSKRPVVGFNVSGLLCIGGYTRDNMFGLAADYKTLVRKAITFFLEEKGATVLLVPHLLWIRGEGDVPACAEIFQELSPKYPDRLFNLMPPYDESEVKHVIGRCDFFVGARMHACIAAFSQCVPAAAMAYSDKFIGVLRSVGLESAVADLRTLTSNEVMTVLESSYDSRDTLSATLKRLVPPARQKVLALWKP